MPSDNQMIRAAKRIHSEDGEVEVDSDAVVSRGDDDGAYVAAWVWVPNSVARQEDDSPV